MVGGVGGGGADTQNGNHISHCMYNESQSEMGNPNSRHIFTACVDKTYRPFTLVHVGIKC